MDPSQCSTEHLCDWLDTLLAHMRTTPEEASKHGLTVAECVAYATPKIAAIEAELARRRAS